MSHQAHLRTRNSSVGFGSRLDHTETATSSPRSLELIQSAAAHLLDLGSASDTALPTTDTDHDVLQARAYGEQGTGASPASDGIFMPGSAYLQFHSALRNHTFHAARSAFPSRCASPERAVSQYGREDVADFAQSLGAPIADIAIFGDASTLSTVPTPAFVELSQQHEYELWKNWVDEIAPWVRILAAYTTTAIPFLFFYIVRTISYMYLLKVRVLTMAQLDKLDDERHFGRALPPLAREHPHLKFSILALSARQLERKDPVRCSLSLALYQEAIHHLVPQLQTRTTTVVASCVVLCVLEMMSCSPKMWRRHLDGCASLILSMGIHGLSGGLEQALFWCFARMDLCGGFISDEQMIIPIGSWLPKSTPDHDDHLLYRSLGFNMYTNYVVHLCGQVVDLLAGSNTGTQGFEGRWHDLFDNLNKWYDDRLPGMKPVLDLSPSETDFSRPFPILLFSSPSAIAGNQLYHTGALLLLQQKPRGVRLKPGTRSVLWHARRISAISISNHNHACWTNCVQPLWFAGRVMSHPAEHRAILETYDLIERETGWGARWRADDLKEYWGDLGGS